MTKELNQPKAVNIIRPSSHSILTQSVKRVPSINYSSSTNSSSSVSMRKPRVASPATSTTTHKSFNDKPMINLYQPPNRKLSSDDYPRAARPPIDLYKPSQHSQANYSREPQQLQQPPPQQLYQQQQQQLFQQQQQQLFQQQQQQQQQRLRKSFTAPSLTAEQLQPTSTHASPIRSHRAVIGPIATPVVNTTVAPKDEATDSIDSLSQIESDTDQSTDDSEDEDESMVNEARVNRKIADLELSIKSLLTVNAMLEATVRKQASQLGQMKKEISSNGITHTPIIEEPEAQEIEDNSGDEHWDDDILFQKLKKLTEQMIDEGQKSIDFEYKILGRVLSNYAPEEDDDEEEEGDTMSDIKDLSIQSNSSIDSNSQSPLQEEKNKSPGPTPSFNHKPRKLRPAAKRGKST